MDDKGMWLPLCVCVCVYQRVSGSSPDKSGGRIFFSGVNFLRWLLFWYPFHSRVTAVSHKRFRSFCQTCRWQVTAKHTYILLKPMWLRIGPLYTAWLYTELAPRWQQYRKLGTSQVTNQTATQTLSWIFKMRCVKLQSHTTGAQWVCSEAENGAIAAIVKRLALSPDEALNKRSHKTFFFFLNLKPQIYSDTQVRYAIVVSTQIEHV